MCELPKLLVRGCAFASMFWRGVSKGRAKKPHRKTNRIIVIRFNESQRKNSEREESEGVMSLLYT